MVEGTLSSFARDVLALFSDTLSDLRFPDVDGDRLELAASELEQAQDEVESAEAALEAARAKRDEANHALEALARKALAYARVFADSDPELAAKVEAIGGARSSAPGQEQRSAIKRRGRPKKEAGEASLFQAEAARQDDVEVDAA
jgi:hypothetical protein